MSSNLGWLFYRDYFKGLDYKDLDNSKNKETIKRKIEHLIKSSTLSVGENETLGNIHFKATTTYPGLILGSGNAHELPKIEEQAILGFSFDYTSGLPVIAGSSIKGVLRSAFKHVEYIKELIEQDVDIKALESEIFDNGDIFFDGTIINSVGNILGDDYLAPHGDNPLKSPTPLRFIKVMPNVTFMFDFELKDGLITKEEKAIVFANILSDLGVGAKTNVGYGKFNSDLVSKTKLSIENQKEENAKREKDRVEKEANEAKEKELQQLDSNIEKIKVQIKDKRRNDTKEIFEIISQYTLGDDEKSELVSFLIEKIGEKPKPKNKAAIKWAIKIYEFLGV